MKEYDAGLYDVLPYVLSKLTIELPIGAIFPVIQISLTYYICGFNPGLVHFLKTILANVLLGWLSFMIAVFFSTTVKDARLVLEVAPLFTIPVLLFSGLLTNISKLIRESPSRP